MRQKIIFSLLMVILFASAGFSQRTAEGPAGTLSICPDETNIANTNVCGVYGDGNGNSNWNWELNDPLDPQYCKNWYARTVPSGFLVSMGSPFVNATSGNIKIIADNLDYTKAKGWQLLQRKFGCLTNIANPYFVLYNKYTGTIRVYVYLTNGAANYEQLMITVKSVNPHRPATLSSAHDIMLAPDKYLSNSAGNNDNDVLVSINESVGATNWAVGEFHTMLDHNIAEAVYGNGALEVSVYGVITSTLKATVNGSSVTAVSLKDAVFRTSSTSTGGNTFNFTANGEKLTKFSKSIDDFVKGINQNAKKIAEKLKDNPDKLLDGIGKAAGFVEKNTADKTNFEKILSTSSGFIGAAGNVLSFAGSLISFFKGSSATAAPAPTYTNYNLQVEGKITSTVVVSKFVVKIPATSVPSTNANNATYYNCPLGILNLKKTPVFDTLKYERRALMPNYMVDGIAPTTVPYTAYRLHDNVEVVVNTGAGLQVVSIEGALMARVDYPPSSPGLGLVSFDPFEYNPARSFQGGTYNYFNHMRADVEANRLLVTHYDADANEQHILQTPFYKLECLKSASINVHIPVMKPYIRIRATLKRTDGQGELIYFVKDYEADKVAGEITDIPADITYNLAAIPPYANYTIPPNINAYGVLGTPVNADPDDLVYPDNITNNSVTLSTPVELKYNHSITTSDINYTTVTSSTPIVTFRAGGSITLNPNFQATAGSVFEATTNFGYTTVACIPAPLITQFIYPGNCYNTGIIAQRNTASLSAAEQPLKNDAVMVYPNPAKNVLYVKKPGNETIRSMRATDAAGKTVILRYNNAGTQVAEADVSGLRSGLYVLEVTTTSSTRKYKFILMK